MKRIERCFPIIILALLLGWSCASEDPGEPFDPLLPPAGANRRWLTAAQLLAGFPPQETHNGYFLPVGTVTEAGDFSGTVTFSETVMITSHPDSNWEGSGYTIFPGFTMEFMSYRGRLLPSSQKLLRTLPGSASGWNIAIAPGRTWLESGDSGYSRASFPFILTSAGVGQARNGVATFIFRESEISSVFIQISQETAPGDDYTHDNFVATVSAAYTRHQLSNSSTLAAAYETSSAARLPVRPWSDLPRAESLKALFNSGHNESDISAAAILLDGTIYRQECHTRRGPYPYPDEMRHGVYSVTKSLGAGVAMFWLAQRYGEEVFQARITDYVPALRNHHGWRDVTFQHALNMVTGTMGSDEGDMIIPFIRAASAAEKIAAVADLPDDQPLPGEYFRYLSTNTFVLSCAISEFVRKREKSQVDYWNMLAADVLEPLGIYDLVLTRTVEPDNSAGIPVLSWGSYPTLNETARIAELLLNGGVHKGRSLLSGLRTREAVVPGYWKGFVEHYRHSFWWESVMIGSCTVTAPYMSGRGGNSVVLSPGGLVLILFSDNMNYDIAPLLRAAEELQSACN